MKHYFLLLLSVSICFANCTKRGSDLARADTSNGSSVALLDTKIPINDLGTGSYSGFMGGLYPGGVNIPSGQYAKDLQAFAHLIMPLDSNGVVDSSTHGMIAFISLGGSTGGNLMAAMKEKTAGNPLTNPYLRLISCSNGYGSASFNSIMNQFDPYWLHVDKVLKGARTSYKQVQVLYIESEDSTNIILFPARAYRVRNEIEAIMRLCKIRFPNLKLVYVEGRTTTFDKNQVPNHEPSPYYNGWGEKFAIQDQIEGKPGTYYKGDSAVSPLVTWAWYQWANGTTTPRQDGFVWTKDMTTDGIHATEAGEDTLSNRFQNFLLTDRYASIWYKKHSKK